MAIDQKQNQKQACPVPNTLPQDLFCGKTGNIVYRFRTWHVLLKSWDVGNNCECLSSLLLSYYILSSTVVWFNWNLMWVLELVNGHLKYTEIHGEHGQGKFAVMKANSTSVPKNRISCKTVLLCVAKCELFCGKYRAWNTNGKFGI